MTNMNGNSQTVFITTTTVPPNSNPLIPVAHHHPMGPVTLMNVASSAAATPIASILSSLSPKKRKFEDESNVLMEQQPYSPNGKSGGGASAKRRWRFSEGDDHDEVEKRAIANSRITTDGRHICGECGNSLANSWGLDAHIKTVHGRKTFQCDYCDKAFKRRDHLVNHTNSIHTGRKQCSQCGLVCKGKEGLLQHIKDAHPSENTTFPCSACTKRFTSDANTRLHYRQCHAQIKCTECHTLCTGTEGLKTHVQAFHQDSQSNGASSNGGVLVTPVSEQPAAPVPVAKPVSNATLVIPNKRVETVKGELVYKCQFCSGAFIHKTSLEQHIQSFHVEVQCQQCGSQFIGHESMAEHVKEAHQPNTIMYNEYQVCFHCELCNITFNRRSQYDEHFLSYHVSRNANAKHNTGSFPAPESASSRTKYSTVFEPKRQQHNNELYDSIFPPNVVNGHHSSTNNNKSGNSVGLPSVGVNNPIGGSGTTTVVTSAFGTNSSHPATSNQFFHDNDDGIFTTALSSEQAINGAQPTPPSSTPIITTLSTQNGADSFYNDLSSETNVSEAISHIFMANGNDDLFNNSSDEGKLENGLNHAPSSGVEEEPQYQLLELGEPLTA
ncbi:zinc finger and SCAN domain-containing protein 2-like [Tigriopus californicus]|nr:zinc finger and SCAN domain-containing protein 2-like [Tigriopus californicus]XP_059088579.1 zinc finger and SCAN domain-containing protein 2-like [Tigriopus californicus]XP_059088580.1 zinc finger and SCAN domain-containing protein 2-like [Tigriopus californicus]